MVEEQKTEETPKDATAENGQEEKPTENGNGNHAEGETNGDEKKTTENGDNEDDGESSEEELGLLEKPIEILTSKRVRKSVDAYIEPVKEGHKDDEFDYTKGGGLKLGDIPFIKHNIDRADTEDLTVLHRMMYRRVGQANKVKKNIREFCGWPFDEESKEFKSIRSNVIDRLLKEAMRWTLKLLGLDKSDDMEENRAALIEFLKKPVMIEKEIPKRKSSTGGKKKSKTPKKKTSKAKKKKSKETVKEDGAESDVSDASSNDDSSAEEEEEKPKKKTPAKKATPAKKTPKGGTPVKIALPVKKASAKKKRKSTAASDSEDEAPLKKKGNKPPTDAELKKVVSAILKDADLETVTMKNVVKQVYDKYTSFDLSERKDFIKSTVKELIS